MLLCCCCRGLNEDFRQVVICCHALVTCLFQGELNSTIVLHLLDDATPENKDEYTVSLSNIQTFGTFPHIPLMLNLLKVRGSQIYEC